MFLFPGVSGAALDAGKRRIACSPDRGYISASMTRVEGCFTHRCHGLPLLIVCSIISRDLAGLYDIDCNWKTKEGGNKGGRKGKIKANREMSRSSKQGTCESHDVSGDTMARRLCILDPVLDQEEHQVKTGDI